MLFVYSENITPRLSYIIDFFRKELFDVPIILSANVDEYQNAAGPKLNYSGREIIKDEFFIQSTPLLFETGVIPKQVDCFELNYHKAFFQTGGDMPFDIFASTFYLLSRYEEYLPHEKDEYGRYSHKNSLAFREGFLHLPLVNIWIQEFKSALSSKFPLLLFRRKAFKCLLSYDIDMAYSFLHKGWLRTLNGFGRSIVRGKWNEVQNRISVLRGKDKDPFDCYEWLDALHLYCRLKPYYFFLVASSRGEFDKNTSIGERRFAKLIEYYANTSKVGIHPSWKSGDDLKLLKEELEWLEVITERKIEHSRQHYIRLSFPQTYRELIKVGISKEFSMGYGSINGFRASVCSSFNWYDLEREVKTDLVVYPFCFMDANSYFEEKLNPKEAYDELIRYYEIVKKMNGLFISVWHNYILGTDEQFRGWREMFELFMRETVYWDAY